MTREQASTQSKSASAGHEWTSDDRAELLRRTQYRSRWSSSNTDAIECPPLIQEQEELAGHEWTSDDRAEFLKRTQYPSRWSSSNADATECPPLIQELKELAAVKVTKQRPWLHLDTRERTWVNMEPRGYVHRLVTEDRSGIVNTSSEYIQSNDKNGGKSACDTAAPLTRKLNAASKCGSKNTAHESESERALDACVIAIGSQFASSQSVSNDVNLKTNSYCPPGDRLSQVGYRVSWTLFTPSKLVKLMSLLSAWIDELGADAKMRSAVITIFHSIMDMGIALEGNSSSNPSVNRRARTKGSVYADGADAGGHNDQAAENFSIRAREYKLHNSNRGFVETRESVTPRNDPVLIDGAGPDGLRAQERIRISIQDSTSDNSTFKTMLARVKKIIGIDNEIQQCSNNAAFVITIATEMFVQHLVEKTNEIIKAEKRTRRNVQYGDVANAVARLDHLEFLSDVVPRTTTYAKVQERRRRIEEAEAAKLAAQVQHSSPSDLNISNPSQETSAGAPESLTNRLSYPTTFAGPSAGHRSQPINILEGPDVMDVDSPHHYQSHPPLPSTASMLEKARLASARAESGPSPSSSAHPYHSPIPPSSAEDA